MNNTNPNALESHTLSFFVSNKPGVLSRITQIFARRGFNIDSLVVSPGQEGTFSRMTVTSTGVLDQVEQIIKQVSKLVDIIHATDHRHQNTIELELAMIKVAITPDNRTEILQLVEHFKSRTVDFNDESVIIEVSGSTEKLNAFIELLRKYGIIEIARTGKVLMARGTEQT